MSPPRKSIVMVDDEKSYVDLLATMLSENLGYTVHTYTRPREALLVLSTLDAGVIISDYCMPQMTGFEFIKKAAPLVPGVPFVLITGHSVDLPQLAIGPNSPLRAVLAKPFGWRKLAETISQHAPAFNGVRPTPAPFPI